MDDLVNMIIGTSTEFDMYVFVRLIIIMMSLEVFAVAFSHIGGLNK